MWLSKQKIFLKSDYVIYFALIIFSFFCLNQGDNEHTIGCSHALLNGHFWDFYEFNFVKGLDFKTNYLPSTYILFALWGIPIKLLGWATPQEYSTGNIYLWYKVLTTLFFVGTLVILNRIQLILAESSTGTVWKPNTLSLMFATSPIAIYCQFMYGQCDIFTVFFFAFAIYYYLKNNLFKFCLLAGIAITFKYFPFLVAIPLLLLKEKRIPRLLFLSLILIAPSVVEIIPFRNSQAFLNGVFGFGAAQRVLVTMIHFETIKFNLTVFFFCLISIFAYYIPFHLIEKKPWIQFFIGFLTCAIVFSTIIWHPQWLIFIVFFLYIFYFLCSERMAISMIISEVFLSIGFFFHLLIYWNGDGGYLLLTHGLLKNLFLKISDTGLLRACDLSFFKSFDDSFWVAVFNAGMWSILVGFLIEQLVLKKMYPLNPKSQNESETSFANAIRFRFVISFLFFAIPNIYTILHGISVIWGKT